MNQHDDETRDAIVSLHLTPATEASGLYDRIRVILDEARTQTWHAVHTTMLLAYYLAYPIRDAVRRELL